MNAPVENSHPISDMALEWYFMMTRITDYD